MRHFLQRHLSKFGIVVLGAIAGAFLEATVEVLKPLIKPQITEAYYSLEDWWSPIESTLAMHLDFRFYTMSPSGDGSFAATGALIEPKHCLDPKRRVVVHPYFTEALDTKNRLILNVDCRPSGRLMVRMLGQSGSDVTIYNGMFEPGKQIPFRGQPGSYGAGMLQLIQVSVKQPTGPRAPVNKCLLDDSCEFENLMPQRGASPAA